jgi:hypothetical protein
MLKKFNIIIHFYWFLYHLLNYKFNKENPFVSKEIADKRYNICINCPLLNNKGLLVKLKGPRCSLCGCFLKWKVLYLFEKCPDEIQKW